MSMPDPMPDADGSPVDHTDEQVTTDRTWKFPGEGERFDPPQRKDDEK